METNEKTVKAYRAEQLLTKQMRLDGGQKNLPQNTPVGKKYTGNLGRNHGSSSKPILLGYTKKKKKRKLQTKSVVGSEALLITTCHTISYIALRHYP